jgi:hypothetical protein
MTIDQWMRAAAADAEARGLSEVKPLLESLAQALRALRAADFNDRADGRATRTRENPKLDPHESSFGARK